VDKEAIAILGDLCKITEKLALIAYKDPVNKDGLPVTNGFGSVTNRAGELWQVGDRITINEAFWLLQRDIEAAYWPCATIPHWEEMNANQRAALADLNYNEGYTYGDGDHDSLDYALLHRDYLEDLGRALQLYDNNDELGLSRRRYAEWRLWCGEHPEAAYEQAWAMDSVTAIMEAIA
jgi:GH24 family phage-related lysozyme (muramidase)